MKNIIHIYGASGSGTSTLGRKISEELEYWREIIISSYYRKYLAVADKINLAPLVRGLELCI